MQRPIIFAFMMVVAVWAAPSKKTPQEACGNPAELFFLLDSSSSIWTVHFKDQLKFVQDVIEQFEIAPNMTRVGVASFSYRYRSNIPLGAYEDKEGLKRSVGRIRQLLGGTYTFDGLDGVRTRGLNTRTVRDSVTRIAIVITDGQSYDAEKTKVAAQRLKDAGVVVFAIGVGRQTDRKELEAIASEPSKKFVFEVGNYGLLDTIKDSLAVGACNVEEIKDEPEPACGANNPADVMFLVDPVELGPSNSRKALNFISVLIEDFNMKSGNIRVGLESRNCGIDNILLGEYSEKPELLTALKTSKVPGIEHMLHRLRTHSFTELNGARARARRMAVVFVDDKLYNIKGVLDEARKAKNHDIELFVIAIGDSVVPQQLMTMCSTSSKRHFFRVPSYDDLVAYKPKFLEKFCHGL